MPQSEPPSRLNITWPDEYILDNDRPNWELLADALLAHGAGNRNLRGVETADDSVQNPPSDQSNTTASLQLTAGRDDSDYRRCNEECHWILERSKPYRGWDGNENDYHKCIAACLERNRQKSTPAPQPPPVPKTLPWWLLIPRITPPVPAIAQTDQPEAG
jgi:hypothetical protein